MDKHLHIVSFDIPYPADYGGVIDVFYKIVWLHKQGVKIHLHCFTKGRKPQPELNKYCESVHYYPRKTSLAGFSFTLPYIVSSRKSDELFRNLKKDNYPILFEGVHTTYWLHKNKFPGRQVFIRLHNVEYKYYEQLKKNERNFFRQLYFRIESGALRKYEKKIAGKAHLLPMSDYDEDFYFKKLSAMYSTLLPVFTPWNEVTALAGTDNFCLYHGNLSVSENDAAVRWLVKEIFSKTTIQFIVAGSSPSKDLTEVVNQLPNATLHADPSNEILADYLQHAIVNVLPSFNSTGVKLKLLNALYNGRHCLVNSAAVDGTGLEELTTIADDGSSFLYLMQQLTELAFDEKDIQKRKAVLGEKYSNQKNAVLFIKLLR